MRLVGQPSGPQIYWMSACLLAAMSPAVLIAIVSAVQILKLFLTGGAVPSLTDSTTSSPSGPPGGGVPDNKRLFGSKDSHAGSTGAETCNASAASWSATVTRCE